MSNTIRSGGLISATLLLGALGCQSSSHADPPDQGVDAFTPGRYPSSGRPTPRLEGGVIDAEVIDAAPPIERALGADVIYADRGCMELAECLQLHRGDWSRCAHLSEPEALGPALEAIDCFDELDYEATALCLHEEAYVGPSEGCQHARCSKSLECLRPEGCWLDPSWRRGCRDTWYCAQRCAPEETACLHCCASALRDDADYLAFTALRGCAEERGPLDARGLALACPSEWRGCLRQAPEEGSCGGLLRCMSAAEAYPASSVIPQMIDGCMLEASEEAWAQREALLACAADAGLRHTRGAAQIFLAEVAEACPEAWAACGAVIKGLGERCDDEDFCARGAFCHPEERRCVEITCGDGHLTGSEACDDGNDALGDGCEGCEIAKRPLGAACPFGEDDCCVEGAHPSPEDRRCVPDVCGDGRQDGREACDDGNVDEGDGCSAACQVQASLDVSAGGVFDGRVEARSTQRFALRLDAPAHALIEVAPQKDDLELCAINHLDPVLSLFDEAGALVEEADDNGEGARCPRLERRLPAGRYELEVRDYNHNSAFDYQLIVRVEG